MAAYPAARLQLANPGRTTEAEQNRGTVGDFHQSVKVVLTPTHLDQA